MKKILLNLWLSILALLSVESSYSQSYTIAANYEDTSCYIGVTTSPTVRVFGELGSIPAASLSEYEATIFFGDGSSETIPLSAGWSMINKYHSYMSSGVYTIEIKLFHLGTEVATKTIEFATFCTTILINTYHDEDGDCINDYTEPRVHKNIQFVLKAAGIPMDTFTIFANGIYRIESPALGIEYSIEPLDLSSENLVLSCPTLPTAFTLDTLVYPNNIRNFAMDCAGGTSDFDLAITGYTFLRVETGPSYLYWTAFNEVCNETLADITLNISPKYSFNSSDLPYTTASASTVTWNNIPLSNFESLINGISLDAIGSLTVGDTAQFQLTITPIVGDLDAGNNTFLITDTIRASFDPNEKHVNPNGYITAGQELLYTIHFENLGTDTAFNIHIMDPLSNYLDPSSFEMVYSTHTCYPILFEKDGIQYLKFDFPNIKLPEATYPDKNKGMVQFKIKAKESMEPGNTITNTASIYFDFNPAVVTNTVYSSIENPSGIIENLASVGIEIYPNPTSKNLTINNEHNNYEKVILYNLIGQKLLEIPLHKGINNISLPDMSTGTYILNFQGNNVQEVFSKLMIQR